MLALVWIAVAKTGITATLKERLRKARIDSELRKKVQDMLSRPARSWSQRAADKLRDETDVRDPSDTKADE